MGSESEINEFMPLREVVFLTLRKKILKGELQPGERLMEISLANSLGVSRTPIREAIRMLEHEGLVVMRARRGAQVAKITIQELNDVLEVRKSLEVLTEEDLETLKNAETRFEELAGTDKADLTELTEADVSFHDVIYEGTKNRRLIQILGNLREQMYRFRIEYLKEAALRADLVREHRAILKAVEERDAEKAVQLIAEHIDNQHRVINESILEKEE